MIVSTLRSIYRQAVRAIGHYVPSPLKLKSKDSLIKEKRLKGILLITRYQVPFILPFSLLQRTLLRSFNVTMGQLAGIVNTHINYYSY